MKKSKIKAKPTIKKTAHAAHVIDSDGHMRETDEEFIEYMSAGYRARHENPKSPFSRQTKIAYDNAKSFYAL